MNKRMTMMAEVYFMVQDNLYRHIEAVDFLAQKKWDGKELTEKLAREILEDSYLVLRELIAEHQAVEQNGLCRACDTRWPCPVLVSVHTKLKEPERRFGKLLEIQIERERQWGIR